MIAVYLILTKHPYGNKSPIVWFRFFLFSYSTTIVCIGPVLTKRPFGNMPLIV